MLVEDYKDKRGGFLIWLSLQITPGKSHRKRNETFADAENLQRHDWGLLSWEGTRFFGEKRNEIGKPW